jgi:hypothetical protein
VDRRCCSICGIELDARNMAGFTEKPTCLKCAYESIDLNSEDESVKVAFIYGITFAIFFALFFYLAKYVFIY